MEKKNKFTSYALKKEEKRTIFFPKTLKKCQTCSKFQKRRILLPKILPDRHQSAICNCSNIGKKSKLKKSNIPL